MRSRITSGNGRRSWETGGWWEEARSSSEPAACSAWWAEPCEPAGKERAVRWADGSRTGRRKRSSFSFSPAPAVAKRSPPSPSAPPLASVPPPSWPSWPPSPRQLARIPASLWLAVPSTAQRSPELWKNQPMRKLKTSWRLEERRFISTSCQLSNGSFGTNQQIKKVSLDHVKDISTLVNNSFEASLKCHLNHWLETLIQIS